MYEMEFKGLDELISEFDKLGNEYEGQKINREILKECSQIAEKNAKDNMRVSKDSSTSGRKGSRTGQHAKDNIPISNVKTKYGKLYIVVGWEKSDNSPYFYQKFEEWGTSQRPPHPVFGLISKRCMTEFEKIAIKHYEKAIEKLEG